MQEIIGEDLFDKIPEANAICISTNCSLLPNGKNPMGGGSAGAAARRWPEITSIYGHQLMMAPNVPMILGYVAKYNVEEFTSIFDIDVNFNIANHTAVVAYPTMTDISLPANLVLVERSAQLLTELSDLIGWRKVFSGRPGCGIGGLDYSSQVKPALERYFDDRFVIMHM